MLIEVVMVYLIFFFFFFFEIEIELFRCKVCILMLQQ